MKRKSRHLRPAVSASVSSTAGTIAAMKPQAPSAPPPAPAEDPVPRPALSPTAVRRALSPEVTAAVSLNLMVPEEFKGAGLDAVAVMKQLQAEGEAVAGGDLDHVRRTLSTQAAMLNQMFHLMFQIAYANKLSDDMRERYLRLALKAQSQSVQTMSALGRLTTVPADRQTSAPARRTPSPSVTATAAPSQAPAPAKRVVVPLPAFQPNVDAQGNRLRAGAGSALHGLSAPVGG